MLFSVIVPTSHRNDLLARCLDRLAPVTQGWPADSCEAIVTDDGAPGSNAKELIRVPFPWAKWTAGPRRGPAANRNHGAALASGEWLIFVDDDVVPDPQFLRSYAAAIEKYPETRVFEGRTYVDRERRSLAECSPTNETGGFLWSCNFAIRRDLFRELGGFDERFPYACMEDVDFRIRVLASGNEFRFIRDAAVCHPWRRRLPRKEAARYRQSAAVFVRLQPQMALSVGLKAMVMLGARELFKVILPSVLRYRGDGLLNTLSYHFYMILFAAAPALAAPTAARGSATGPQRLP